jgi:hypothetical protein
MRLLIRAPDWATNSNFVRINSDSTKKRHILWYAGFSGEGNNSMMDEKTFSAIAVGQIVGFPKCTEPINSFTPKD